MDCNMPGLPVHYQLLELTQTNVHWVSDAIQPSHPLLPPSTPALNLSFLVSGSFPTSQLFASGGQGIGVRLSISPSNKYSGLISFRMDWLDLLAVQETLKSLLQDHSFKQRETVLAPEATHSGNVWSELAPWAHSPLRLTCCLQEGQKQSVSLF